MLSLATILGCHCSGTEVAELLNSVKECERW
jgi:hypothetical protein